MKRLSSIALIGAFLALGATACDSDTGPEPGVTGVQVSPDEVTIEVGESTQLTAQVSIEGGASTDVEWASSNPSVASVTSDGTVTGESEGTTTVLATSVDDGSKSDAAQVTVVAPEPKKISIAGYRAVTNAGTSPVQAPDTVGTECCGSGADHVVLEVTYDVDPGDANIDRVQMTMDGEVVSEQVFSSKEGAAFSHREQDVVISKSTLDFMGELDGSLITPDLPNGSYELGGKVVFSDGTETSVSQTRTVFVRNHQRVIFARVDGGNSGVSTAGLRFWGGTTITFGATVIDHAGIGVGLLEIAEDDATADTDFDMGAGVDAPVQFSGPPFTFATDAAANAGLAGGFDPLVTDIRDGDGETYSSQSVPWVEEYDEPFLTGAGSPVSPSEAVPLDYVAPTADGPIVVVNSAGATAVNSGSDHFSVGEFQASTQSDVGVGIIDSTAFRIMAPAADLPAAPDTIMPVDSINDLPERTIEYGAEMMYIADILGNANTDPGVGPNGPFGVDVGEPIFSDVLPDSGVVLKGVPDDLNYMLSFFAEDALLATGDPGSGADHASSTVEIFDDAGASVATATATDGAGAAGSDFDFNSDDAAPEGDYHVDVMGLVGEGTDFTAAFTTPDNAIIPNVGDLEMHFSVDATPPTATQVDPPSEAVQSSDDQLIFTIEGEASDNFELAEVLVTVRDASGNANDLCELSDPLIAEGTSAGQVNANTIDVTATAKAGERFSEEITIQNAGSGTLQHVCWFIEARDMAKQADGTDDPWVSTTFTHTDIDWQ